MSLCCRCRFYFCFCLPIINWVKYLINHMDFFNRSALTVCIQVTHEMNILFIFAVVKEKRFKAKHFNCNKCFPNERAKFLFIPSKFVVVRGTVEGNSNVFFFIEIIFSLTCRCRDFSKIHFNFLYISQDNLYLKIT